MENSGKILFEDDRPEWYLAVGEHWEGPLTAAEVYRKVQSGEATVAHFVWRKAQSEWKRICDVPTFQVAMPTQPPKGIQVEVKKAAVPEAPKLKHSVRPATRRVREEGSLKIWYLYYSETQFGPFSEEEIAGAIRSGKIHGRVHAWKEGIPTWKRIEQIPELEAALSGAPKGKSPHREEAREEKRGAPRKPLIAKILLTDEDTVIVGMCRDISIGGMQVLTDRIPGPVGTRIRLNISPSSGTEFEPFVAHGAVVRILEDGRGFSFRFEKLSEAAKNAIGSYID